MAKILNGFFTFRTTLKTVSSSIQQMEKFMDSTFQFLNGANSFRNGSDLPLPDPSSPNNEGRGRSRGRGPKRNNTNPQSLIDDLEVPNLQLPVQGNSHSSINGGFPFASIFQNIDLQQVMRILQSPFIRGMLSRVLQPRTASTSHSFKHDQKFKAAAISPPNYTQKRKRKG